ncbi:MAG: hypothetical protein CMJ90_08900 [Planctomycetes bacterium]|nr:hypothetical protein [Planctomycetota bacterium]
MIVKRGGHQDVYNLDMYRSIIAAGLLTAALVAQSGLSTELKQPVRIMDGDAPIAVGTGHAAPFLIDLDGDGKRDLVVGQFAGGKARVYTNVGTDAAPRFKGHTWLQAGGGTASVPPS